MRNQLPMRPGCFQQQQNYSQLDNEGLGIIFGVKKFYQYLFGWTFQIVTNHKPLISLFSQRRPIFINLPPRIRWSLLMSSYLYRKIHKSWCGMHHSPNRPPGWHYSRFCRYLQRIQSFQRSTKLYGQEQIY